MANANVPVLAQFARHDGAWIRCSDCDDAFWGDFRPTAFVVAKLQAHRAKAHGGAQRPQRRAQAAKPQAGLLVNVDALLAGKRLGAGVAREGRAADVIVKRAHTGQEAHNLAEWKAYNSAPAHLRKWLCPVVACAPDGSWLLMRRAERVGACSGAECDQVERALGHYIRDLHPGNIGIVDGRPVATDYAGGWQAHEVKW
jgi:hypothetical protein